MKRFLTLFLLLAVLLSACAAPGQPPEDEFDLPLPTGSADNGGPAETPTSSDGVTISFAAWESERALYEQLAEAFTAENPNIKVVIVPLDDLTNFQEPSGPQNPLDALRRVVSGADTAPSFYTPPEAFGSSLLMDLAPLIDADASFSRDDYYPGALERVTVKGGTWVLPRYVYVQILSYNKDLFEAADLPEPQPGWSWADLLGAAEQLGRKNGNTFEQYGYFDYSGGFTSMMALLESKDVNLLSQNPSEVQFDQPDVVDTLTQLRDLHESGALYQPGYARPIAESGGDEPIEDPQQIIREGRVGIWPSDITATSYGPDGPQQPEPLPFEAGSVPYPALKGGMDFFGGYADGYIISAGTAHPNESWKWIEFLTRQQTDQGGVGIGAPGRIPARKSTAETTGYWNSIDPQIAETYQLALASMGTPAERTLDYTVLGPLQQALYEVITSDKDPSEALASAQKTLEEQLAQQAELTPTPEADDSPVVVATPEPQTAPEGAIAVRFGVPGYMTSNIRRLARTFREQNPDYFIQIKSTDTYTGPVELKDIASANDCFAWWSPPQSEADIKALLDLQPLFDSDASFARDDYPAALFGAYTRDGGLYGLPYSFNIRTLGYNRTLFDATGVAPPDHTWLPDDFLSAAKALTSGEGDQKKYGYVPYGGGPLTDMSFFVGQFGGRLSTGSGRDARPAFDDPKTVAAIQWYIDLAKVHKVTPEFQIPYKRDDSGYADPSYDLVQTGRAGMWFDYGYGSFASEPAPGEQPRDFEVGVAPLPVGGAGLRGGDLYSRGFHISAANEQPQGCWEWLKFLSTDTANLQGELPARISVAQSPDFTSTAQPALLEVYQAYGEALERAGDPTGGLDALYGATKHGVELYWFNPAIAEAIEGEADLAQGLAEAQELTLAHIDCVEETDKPATCATEVDPDYQGFLTEDPSPSPAFPRG